MLRVLGHFPADTAGLPNWDANPEFTNPRSLVIVMPMYDSPLQSLIRDGGVSDVAAIAIGVQVCEGLLHLHRHGIVHRDMKPDNVFMRRQRRHHGRRGSGGGNDGEMMVADGSDAFRDHLASLQRQCLELAVDGDVDVVVADVGEHLEIEPEDDGSYDFKLPYIMEQRAGCAHYYCPEVANAVPGRRNFIDYGKQVQHY